MSSQNEIVGGRYALGELLGEGAFAFTYRAHDLRLGRDVALKILRSVYANDTTFTARFTREAVAVASISHLNVVQVFDHGRHDDTLYIAMEFVKGRTLRQVRLDAGGRLPPAHAVDLAVQVLRGLQAVHRAGIIHRDIKPENILVGQDGIARLADFGIATDPGGMSLTMTGTTLGTAAYMAPEQARGEALTPAADLYAVGVVLYEMLAGRLPFRSDNAVAMMLAHQQAVPPPIRQVAPDVGIPARLDAIVQTALAKNPTARVPTAQAMERALLSRDEQTAVSPAVDRTATMPAVQARKVQPRPVARPAQQVPSGFGRGWLLALALLAALAGSAAAAAWWTGWNAGDSDPTSTPRVLEAVSDEPTETSEPEPTEEGPPAGDPPDPTETVGIIPIDTETPIPFVDSSETPEPEPTDTETTEPDASPTHEEAAWTPTSGSDSPPIEPVD